MSALLDGIAKNHFIIVGRAGIDFFTDPGVRVEDAERVTVDLGGSSANIGAGICKLGGQASLVTRVSDDSIGSYCISRLKHYGVGTEYVRPVGGEYRNSLAVYESVTEGHRNVIYRNMAADFRDGRKRCLGRRLHPLRRAHHRRHRLCRRTLAGCDVQGLRKLAKQAGLPIIFDVDYRPYSWPSPEVAADVLSRAAAESDMIVGNDEEFGFMAGAHDKGLAKARDLSEAHGKTVIYKMGGEGAITFAGGEEIRTGIYPVEALKPVGAGDSFMAGLMTGLAQGLDLKAAVLRGSACASVTVSKPGCAPAMPDSETIATFLAEHPGPTEG